MRIDKFLNSTNVVKRRAIAQDMLDHGVVSINGVQAKPSKTVKIGDIIEIAYLSESKKYRVLKIPETKNIQKSQKEEYVEEL